MTAANDKDVELMGGTGELKTELAIRNSKEGASRDDSEMAYYGKKQQLKVGLQFLILGIPKAA